MDTKNIAPYIGRSDLGLSKGISYSLDYMLTDTYTDAALNLYEIYFEPQGEAKLDTIYSYRTNYIAIPKRKSTTSEVMYQNVKIPLLSPGSDIDKQLSFTLRIDRDYLTVKAFEKSLAHKPNGEFDYNSSILWDITVFAYKNDLNGDSNDFTPVKKWKFKNCKIVEIASYNYDYSSVDVPTTTVSFIWGEVDDTI